MATNRSIPISEARRRLPELVQSVWRSGGRIDVTHRGEVRASIVRAKRAAPPASGSDALRVELVGDAADLPDIIRELRRRTGRPRSERTQRRRSR